MSDCSQQDPSLRNCYMWSPGLQQASPTSPLRRVNAAVLGSWRALVHFHMPHLRIPLWILAVIFLHWKAGPSRSLPAIRKEAGLFHGSFLRKGKVLALVGSIQNLKYLKDFCTEQLDPWCFCNPTGTRGFLWLLSTEGRGVGLCGEYYNPKGPGGPKGSWGLRLLTGPEKYLGRQAFI